VQSPTRVSVQITLLALGQSLAKSMDHLCLFGGTLEELNDARPRACSGDVAIRALCYFFPTPIR
jgi:hypothetical protein